MVSSGLTRESVRRNGLELFRQVVGPGAGAGTQGHRCVNATEHLLHDLHFGTRRDGHAGRGRAYSLRAQWAVLEANRLYGFAPDQHAPVAQVVAVAAAVSMSGAS